MQTDSNHEESGSTGSHLQRSSHFLQQHLRKLQRKRQRAVLPIISPCLPMALACSFNVSIRYPPRDEQSPSSWRHQCIFHRCISMHYLSLWVLTSTFSACLQRNDSAIANLPAFPPQSNQDTSCMLDTVIALSSLLGLELPFPHLGECNSHNISVLSERKERITTPG